MRLVYSVCSGFNLFICTVCHHLIGQTSEYVMCVFSPLVKLIEARNNTVQLKAASAVEAMCADNPVNQQEFLDREAPRYLIRLLKVIIYSNTGNV